MSLLDEIREQPAAAARFLDRQLPVVREIAAVIRRHDPAYVLIAARGTSDHAAIYAQYAFGLRNRLPVALAAPSMFLLYGSPPRLERSVVIAISQSGASPDIVEVVAAARAQGVPTVAVTNEPGSPLAVAAEHVIALEAGPETAVAATKTYTTQLLAIAALSAALAAPDARGAPGAFSAADEAALQSVPAALETALGAHDAAALATRESGMTRAVVLGRGYEYATAREWALKLQELAQVLAHPWSSADFEHGPLALLEPGLPVLAIVPDDVAGDGLLDLLRRLRTEHDADVITVSGRADARDLDPIDPGSTLPPWLAPTASIVPGQLFAAELAVAKGLDPERPRALTKVTRTR